MDSAGRLIYLRCLLLLAVSLLGIGTARAQVVHFQDAGEAYAACLADASSAKAAYPGAVGSNLSYNCAKAGTTHRCAGSTCWWVCAIDSPNPTGSFQCDCRTRANSNVSTQYTWPILNTCTAREDYTSTFTPPSGSTSCRFGCEVAWFYNGDGTSTAKTNGLTCNKDAYKCLTGFYWHNSLNVCAPEELEDCKPDQTPKPGVCKPPENCPEGMVENQQGLCEPKKNECPAGQIKSPEGACLPGEGQCAAGEVRRENGTCGKDANGDGKADDDDDDPNNDPKTSFSGGDNCNAPPSCSGDPILCGQARIQWRIDCNTRKNRNVSGGSCSVPPICTGEKCDAMEYQMLLMQWRTACALEKNTSPGGGDGGQPDWTKVGGMSQDPGAGSSPDDVQPVKEIEMRPSDLDQSGFGGGAGMCPTLLVHGASGGGLMANKFAQQLASPPPIWCNFIGDVYAIMLVFGAAIACFILARG